jgi:DNA-binding MarR family transcriptional regulator
MEQKLKGGGSGMAADEGFSSGLMSKVKVEQATSQFIRAVGLIDRLQAKHHEIIGRMLEARNLTDLTPVQAVLLYNLGDREIMAGEMRSRGIYLGSNVSYNLKKLVGLGYLAQRPSPHDRRAVQVSLTDKGKGIRDLVNQTYSAHAQKILATCPIDFQDVINLENLLQVIDQFWSQELYIQSKSGL